MSTSERILYVDDDQPVRAAFPRAIATSGLEVEAVAGPREALERARVVQYAVIVTDYAMPGMNGLEAVEALRPLQPMASFVLVSGSCDVDLALEAINEHGVHFVLPKPWRAGELQDIIRRALVLHSERVLQASLHAALDWTGENLERQRRRLLEAMDRRETLLAKLLLNALDLRHHETRAHCRRVSAHAAMLAEACGVRGAELAAIRQGALLHDVGKIGVPDRILLKPGPLTPGEWAVMREHSAMGAQLLEGFSDLAGPRRIVLEHHERWDGSGYPAGLAGERICLGARIFAVADTLDAMLSTRPYRQAMSFEEARREIQRVSGTQLDPEIVERFVAIPAERWLEVQAAFADRS